jgi:DNA-binding XRE family transcriptional regulator
MTTKNKRLLPLLEKDLGPMTFAIYLRVSRDLLQLSQASMAKKLKMKTGTLCDIEKGRQLVSVSLATKIAKTCALPLALAVQAALQDQVYKAKLKLKVEVA